MASFPKLVAFLPWPDIYYLMGGFNSYVKGLTANRASNQNFEINLKTGRCTRKKPLPIARFAFGLCTYGQNIIVVSGLDQCTQEDFGQEFPISILECDRYLPEEDKWEIMPNLPEGRINPTVLAIDHFLYVFGGVSDN